MADRDLQAHLVSQVLQAQFPKAVAAAVAPAPVCCDQQPRRAVVHAAPHSSPPAFDRRLSELGRVVVEAHAYPAFIARQVVDAIRDVDPEIPTAKVVHADRQGRSFGLRHSWPGFLKFPTNSRFFASTEITGWPCFWNALTCLLMCRNWASRSGLSAPSESFTVGLQTVAHVGNQAGDGFGVADRMSLALQLPGQLPRLLQVHSKGHIGSSRASSPPTAPASRPPRFHRHSPASGRPRLAGEPVPEQVPVRTPGDPVAPREWLDGWLSARSPCLWKRPRPRRAPTPRLHMPPNAAADSHSSSVPMYQTCLAPSLPSRTSLCAHGVAC